MNELAKRLISYAYKNKLAHLGSCLTALPIIEHIYNIKQPDEKFILSCGHAALALYVVLEAKGIINLDTYDYCVHPNRQEGVVDCSTGSLGQGLPVALGMAIANPSKKVYCLISDGECAEGSIWEALLIKYNFDIDNLIVYVNINGYSAYDSVYTFALARKLESFCPRINIVRTSYGDYPFLQGVEAHYHILTEEEFKNMEEQWQKK